jgi:hypothetical protein
MVSETKIRPQIESLDSFTKDRNLRICCRQAAVGNELITHRGLYPSQIIQLGRRDGLLEVFLRLKPLNGFPTDDEMLDDVSQEDRNLDYPCDAVVMGEEDWQLGVELLRNYPEAGNKVCGFMKLGDPVLTLNRGLMVSERMVQPLEYWKRKMIEDGVMYDIFKKHFPLKTCDGDAGIKTGNTYGEVRGKSNKIHIEYYIVDRGLYIRIKC